MWLSIYGSGAYMFKNTLPAFLIAIGVASAGYSVGNAISQNQSFNQYVTVKGLAEKTVKSDKAVWQLYFSVADDEVADAHQDITKAQTAIKDFLQQQGFAAEDITLQPVSVIDNYANAYSSNEKGKRYMANAGVVLTTHQVDNVQKAIQQTGALVQQGVLINSSVVRYSYTELNAIKPGLLDEATSNARAAGEAFARNAHSHLGSIRQASQGLFTITDVSDASSTYNDVMKKVRVVTTVEYFLK